MKNLKRCKYCREDLSFDSFNKDKWKKDGLSNRCKECWVKYRKENCEKLKAQSKQYHIKNREKRLIKQEEYRKNNKEKIKLQMQEFYKKNKDRMEEARKKYDITCSQCGNDFKGYKKTKFCSRKCFYEDAKISRKGVNNPSYRNGGYIKVAGKKKKLAWKERLFQKNAKEIREDMMKEYGYYFCQNCKVNESARWETHHIVYRSRKPKHEHLHDKSNLIRCCIKCHNKLHKDKDLTIKYIKERKLNELFKDDGLLY